MGIMGMTENNIWCMWVKKQLPLLVFSYSTGPAYPESLSRMSRWMKKKNTQENFKHFRKMKEKKTTAACVFL